MSQAPQEQRIRLLATLQYRTAKMQNTIIDIAYFNICALTPIVGAIVAPTFKLDNTGPNFFRAKMRCYKRLGSPC